MVADVLGQTRYVIRLVNEGSREEASTSSDDCLPELKVEADDEVRGAVARGEEMLKSLGFRGQATVEGVCPGAEGVRALMKDVVEEACANVARHGDACGSFALVLRMSSAGFSLICGNRTARRQGHLPKSGVGLPMMRRRVERMRGTVDASDEDGERILHVEVPDPADLAE